MYAMQSKCSFALSSSFCISLFLSRIFLDVHTILLYKYSSPAVRYDTDIVEWKRETNEDTARGRSEWGGVYISKNERIYLTSKRRRRRETSCADYRVKSPEILKVHRESISFCNEVKRNSRFDDNKSKKYKNRIWVHAAVRRNSRIITTPSILVIKRKLYEC